MQLELISNQALTTFLCSGADTEPGADGVYLCSGGLIPSRALMEFICLVGADTEPSADVVYFLQLELIPSQALMACSELLHLDLSNNELDALPPQLRRKKQLSVFHPCTDTSVADPYPDRHQDDADQQH